MVSATVVGFAMMVCAPHCRKISRSVVDWAPRPHPPPRDGRVDRDLNPVAEMQFRMAA
jgi:hypothetical protein